MENTTTPISDAQDIAKGKTNAILSYCTPIGWIIGFVLHSSAKSRFAAYHLRQGLGLWCLAMGIGIASVFFLLVFYMFILYLAIRLLQLGVLAFAVMGLINASNGKMEPVPLLGDFFNKIFSGIN
jgi:uncharacterized membrane protein